MTEKHDEALIDHLMHIAIRYSTTGEYIGKLRSAIRGALYPPALSKTRLEVTRELLAAHFYTESGKRSILSGEWDNGFETKAVMAALAMDKMED